MSDFVVHSVPGSPFGRAVLATLIEKGAAFTFATVGPGGPRGEAHLQRHPFGRVPVLEHQGFLLYETQAILRYLDRVLPEPALTPADPRTAARMDQLMNISDWYLFQGALGVIGFQRIVGPRMLGLPTDEAAIAAAMPNAHKAFAEISRLAGDQPYLTGAQLTLADLMIAPNFAFVADLPEWGALTEGRANLVTWLARMNARKSMTATTVEQVAALAQPT